MGVALGVLQIQLVDCCLFFFFGGPKISKLMRSLIESYYEFVRSFRKIVDADVLFVQYCLGMLGAVKFLLYTYPGLQKTTART